MPLSRSDVILKYIVEYFIKKAQPIGSNTLIEEYKMPYSSATIRNEMYALEKMGYIEKTHSSSGRVPSAKGYKYYCDNLRDKNVSDEFKNAITTVLEKKIQSIEEVIKESCEILSHMTSLVSVVVDNNEKEETLTNVQLIQISEKTLTAIFVTNKGHVENKTFVVPDDMSAEEIVNCMNLLNERLKGTPISELCEKVESLKPVLSDYIVKHDVVYQALMETFLRFASDRLSLYGRDELFNHPEFANDSMKLQEALKMLDNYSVFKDNVNETDETKVNIGENNADVSIVTKKVKIGDEEQTISLLGPTRIDYDNAISALEYIAEALNKYFDDMNKGGNDNDA